MIQVGTRLKVADNTGAKMVKCFTILGGTRKRYARIGDTIVCVIKEAEPRRDVKAHTVARAVVIRQRQAYKRKDGSYIRFGDNACCLISEGKMPKGNRISGPVPKELKDMGFSDITAMAKDII